MWFVFALITTLAWGAADLFYKKGADGKYSHLRTVIAVGVVMGIHAIVTLLVGDFTYDFSNMIVYLPVSLMYILSMAVGYFGLRYLELSISSPVQNASGAVVCIMCLIFLRQALSVPSAVAVALITVGIVLLGYFQQKKEVPKEQRLSGRVAFIFPLIYCLLDSLGTFFDAWYLDDWTSTPLKNVTEDSLETVANVSYELTFLLCAIIAIVYLLCKKQEVLVFPGDKNRLAAAVLETAGQFTYVFAMSGRGVVAAPMVASYCVVSVIFSRIFLREKLPKEQYAAVFTVIAGIIIMGIAEAL